MEWFLGRNGYRSCQTPAIPRRNNNYWIMKHLRGGGRGGGRRYHPWDNRDNPQGMQLQKGLPSLLDMPPQQGFPSLLGMPPQQGMQPPQGLPSLLDMESQQVAQSQQYPPWFGNFPSDEDEQLRRENLEEIRVQHQKVQECWMEIQGLNQQQIEHEMMKRQIDERRKKMEEEMFASIQKGKFLEMRYQQLQSSGPIGQNPSFSNMGCSTDIVPYNSQQVNMPQNNFARPMSMQLMQQTSNVSTSRERRFRPHGSRSPRASRASSTSRASSASRASRTSTASSASRASRASTSSGAITAARSFLEIMSSKKNKNKKKKNATSALEDVALDARTARLFDTKSAVKFIREVLPGARIDINLPQGSTVYKAQIILEQMVIAEGQGETNATAAQQAAERAIKTMFCGFFCAEDSPVRTGIPKDLEFENPINIFPWIEFASYALHKMFVEWETGGVKIVFGHPKNKGSVKRKGSSELKKSMGKLPWNVSQLNPCSLLHKMKPEAFCFEIEKALKDNQGIMTVAYDIDGQVFIGQAHRKKDAKREAAKSALKSIYGVTFQGLKPKFPSRPI